MIAQAKILRVLKLIALLKSRSKTITQIASTLEITERSVYRYLDLLEEVGFVLDKDFENRYFIHVEENEKADFSFSTDESILIKELVTAGAQNHPLKETILKKLYLNSDLKKISKNLEKARLGALIKSISDGISLGKQMVFKQYHSANSNEIRDRLVEPFEISDDYEDVTAYDTEDGKVKHFKLERISNVILLDKNQKHLTDHTKSKTDMFGLSGEKEVWITLELSLRSYLLMREEYPKSIPFLKKENSTYVFHGPVLGYAGIGRFVLGLFDTITIKGPAPFKKYIKERLREFSQRIKNPAGLTN